MSGGICVGMDFKAQDNGRNIKLDQAEFIDPGPLSGDSRLNMEVHMVFFKDVQLSSWAA